MNPRKEKAPSEKDLELLKEFGFRRTQSRERKMVLLDKLRMRQLDQLKMMFIRVNFMENELFPHNVKEGILRNDLSSYCDAIHALFAKEAKRKRLIKINNAHSPKEIC